MEKNRKKTAAEEKYELNAYHSPFPMNELCDYICAWERKHVLWNRGTVNLSEIRRLIVNSRFPLSDRSMRRTVRRLINDFACRLRTFLEQCREQNSDDHDSYCFNALIQEYRELLRTGLPLEEEHIANYVISVSYGSLSISKSLAWSGYGSYILDNLKRQSPVCNIPVISEVPAGPPAAYEYLGKYYELKEGPKYKQLFL